MGCKNKITEKSQVVWIEFPNKHRHCTEHFCKKQKSRIRVAEKANQDKRQARDHSKTGKENRNEHHQSGDKGYRKDHTYRFSLQECWGHLLVFPAKSMERTEQRQEDSKIKEQTFWKKIKNQQMGILMKVLNFRMKNCVQIN